MYASLSLWVDTLTHYSGLASSIIVWGAIVIHPINKLSIKLKQQTISQAMIHNKSVLTIVCRGLIVGGIFQGLFLLYLTNRFNFSIYSPISYLYMSLSLAAILAGIFNPARFPKKHLAVSIYYFFFSPIMMLTLGYSLYNSEKTVATVSLLCGMLYILGEFLIMANHRNIRNAYLEIYSFFTLSVWGIIITFI